MSHPHDLPSLGPPLIVGTDVEALFKDTPEAISTIRMLAKMFKRLRRWKAAKVKLVFDGGHQEFVNGHSNGLFGVVPAAIELSGRDICELAPEHVTEEERAAVRANTDLMGEYADAPLVVVRHYQLIHLRSGLKISEFPTRVQAEVCAGLIGSLVDWNEVTATEDIPPEAQVRVAAAADIVRHGRMLTAEGTA